MVYQIATKVIAQADQTPLRQKVIIADDTINNKTGKKWSSSATISITKTIAKHWVISVYKSVITLEFNFFYWLCYFTHPKNVRTPICARLINAPAAGSGDRKP
ncbi:MAG: hypothetical protein ACUVTX_10020 [Bacteroidales bacterium]